MEPKTNWGRIFGGILLLAIIYLLWRAFNLGKDGNYGEVTNVMKPNAYKSASMNSGSNGTGAIDTGEAAADVEVKVEVNGN